MVQMVMQMPDKGKNAFLLVYWEDGEGDTHLFGQFTEDHDCSLQ